MKNLALFLPLLLIMAVLVSPGTAQILEDEFPPVEPIQKDLRAATTMIQQRADLEKDILFTPVEGPIDPHTYIVGPGDILGINIVATENVTIPVRINPTGDVIIPGVGIVDIAGKTLAEAKQSIVKYVADHGQRSALVDVTLNGIRSFKVLVTGAVQNPGFVEVSGVDRVYDAILKAGGLQKYAHRETISLKRGGETYEINLKEFLTVGDLSQNPFLLERDVVDIPFNDYAVEKKLDVNEYNRHQVIVSGFVNQNNTTTAFNYLPGYKVRDYIAMTGGPKEAGKALWTGKQSKAIIYRAEGTVIKNAIDEHVLPGDVIIVPPTLAYQILGGEGIVRTLTAVATLLVYYEYTRNR
jgi:protein involved in polysaccharide export with SLBB domain